MSGNAYLLQTLQGKDLPKALNERFLDSTILVCGKMPKRTDVITSSLLLLVCSAPPKGKRAYVEH
jgi:hypothetical protein